MYSKSNKERKDNQISCTFAVSNTLNEKDMKKLAICITLIAAILTGCNGDEKAAQARLDKARAMYENNEFFGAKNEIDSIRTLYPKEVKVLKQGLTLMRQVEVKEAERNIAFCDSLLPIKLEEVEGLKKGFAFEKDSVYEENRQLYLETADDRAQRATLLRTLRRERGGRDVSGQRILRRTPHRAYGNQAEPERRPIRRDRFHPVRRRTELPLQGYGKHHGGSDLQGGALRRCRQVHLR
mgnify:CR=1 FL=1